MRRTAPQRRNCLSCIVGSLAVIGTLLLSGCGQRPADPRAAERPRVGLLPADSSPPNIIFILIDTLRADALGAYGNRAGLTPHMDQITRDGVLFERCFANAPWTLPSVASMLTCYHPTVHGATSYREVQDMHDRKRPSVSVLNDEAFHTLPELLRDAGYETAGFVANKFLHADFGFAQGYDHYDTSFADNTVRGELVNNAALAWLAQRNSNKPLFLYLHYMDVHGPYNAAREFMDPLIANVRAIPPAERRLLTPEQFSRINPYLRKPPDNGSDLKDYEELRAYREYWVARYEAGVAEMDHYLGQMIDELRQRGLWDNSYVILTSDHGEALGEHGYWDHGYTLFNTDLHVPLALRWPGVLPAGSRVRENVSLLDILPTVVDQLRGTAKGAVQGRSLVDAMSGTTPTAPVSVFAGSVKAGPEANAIIRENWKLIRITTGAPEGQPPFIKLLLDLAKDPQERASVWNSNETLGLQLEALLDAQLKANQSIKPAYEVEFRALSPEQLRNISAVGYVASSSEEDEHSASQPTSDTAVPPGESVP